QRFVSQGVEQRAELARHVEALGEKAVDRIADPGDDEDHKGDLHLAGSDGPDDDRDQKDPAQRDDVRNGVWNTLTALPGYRFDFTENPALCGLSWLLST